MQQAQHRADFAGGPARNVEKRQQFLIGAALEAFGNVVRDGDGDAGAFDLVAQAVAILELRLGGSASISPPPNRSRPAILEVPRSGCISLDPLFGICHLESGIAVSRNSLKTPSEFVLNSLTYTGASGL